MKTPAFCHENAGGPRLLPKEEGAVCGAPPKAEHRRPLFLPFSQWSTCRMSTGFPSFVVPRCNRGMDDSRGSANPEDHSSNGPLSHGETHLGPRLRGDDELSIKLFARH